MTVGTPEYMSPEQAMAKDISTGSELYSIGCMTYEMLTGRLPFNEGSQAALLMQQVTEPVSGVREVDPPPSNPPPPSPPPPADDEGDDFTIG